MMETTCTLNLGKLFKSSSFKKAYVKKLETCEITCIYYGNRKGTCGHCWIRSTHDCYIGTCGEEHY